MRACNGVQAALIRPLLLLLALLLPALMSSAAAAADLAGELDAYVNGKGPLYHTSQQLLDQITALAAEKPDTVRTFQLSTVTAGQKSLTAAAVGQFDPAVTAAGAPLNDKPLAFIMCSQHAREVIAAEVCFWLVRALAGDVASLSQWPETQQFVVAAGKTVAGSSQGMVEEVMAAWAARLRSLLQVQVVPVMNEEGRLAVQRGQYDLRKTVDTQVDLNRNWPVGWSTNLKDDESDPKGQTYKGPKPLSEWQTRAVFNHLSSAAVKRLTKSTFVDVHSGTYALLVPWGYKTGITDISSTQLTAWQAVLNKANKVIGGIRSGNSGNMLYISHGTSDDNAYKTFKFRYVATFEVYTSDPFQRRGFKCPTLTVMQQNCDTLVNFCATAAKCSLGGKLVAAKSDQQEEEELAAAAAAHAAAAAEAEAVGQEPVGAAAADNANVQKNDPFMKRLNTRLGRRTSYYFELFNPTTPEAYRETVAMWVVVIMQALEQAAGRPINLGQ